jgi:hypothetical protein
MVTSDRQRAPVQIDLFIVDNWGKLVNRSCEQINKHNLALEQEFNELDEQSRDEDSHVVLKYRKAST